MSPRRARLAVNQSDADAVETVLWTETQYSFHFPKEGGGGSAERRLLGGTIFLFFVLVQCRTAMGWNI